ncbi:hypothetical protein RI367_008784 [Sorochytrium milnesiophthora]
MPPATRRCLLVGIAYIALSVAILAVNKHLFSAYKFRFPGLLFALQMVCGLTLSQLMHRWGLIQLSPVQSMHSLRALAPLALAYLLNVFLSLIALDSIDIALYNALRRTGIMFVLFFEYISTGSLPSHRAARCLALLMFGAICACMENARGNAASYGVAFLSNVATAVYMVLIKRTNAELNLESMDLYVRISMLCLPVLLLYVAVTGELSVFLGGGYAHAANPALYLWLALSLSAAFGLNYVIYLNTITNGPLGQCVAAQIKDSLILLIGLFMFSTQAKSALMVSGLLCSLAGGVWYSSVSLSERAAPTVIRWDSKHKLPTSTSSSMLKTTAPTEP